MVAPNTGEPPASIAVTNLSFRYPGAPAAVLTDITFTVRAGQVLGVLGANGSGKSTLLHALLGARVGERRGEVVLRGHTPVSRRGISRRDISRRDISRRDIGFAAQQTALYHLLTVRENLQHAARTLVARRAVRGAVDDAIAAHGLDAVATIPVHQLSGGWQRLTHIATSFVHRPQIRLLDEPTAALDFDARGRLVALVEDWRRAGTTMLVTSHYPEDIDEICTHALVIRDGVVARQDTLADLLARHPREPTGGARAGNRLRDVLAADPRLTGLLDEGGRAR